MTTDPNTLTEKIAHDLFLHDMRAQGLTADWAEGTWDDMGGSERSEERVDYEMRAAAVLPLVRAAQADALREAAHRIFQGVDEGPVTQADIARAVLRHELLTRAAQYEKENTDG